MNPPPLQVFSRRSPAIRADSQRNSILIYKPITAVKRRAQSEKCRFVAILRGFAGVLRRVRSDPVAGVFPRTGRGRRPIGCPPCASGSDTTISKSGSAGSSTSSPSRSACRCSRCPWPVRCRSPSAPGCSAGWPPGRRARRSWRERLGLREQGTLRVLEVLTVAGILKLGGERFEIASRQRKWLDPESSTYVGDFLADNIHYWEWWQDLEGLVRDGRSVELHDKPPEDPYWRSYITGQYQLAKLSSAAVAKAVQLPAGSSSLLDVAGAHGEFSMALCRRHEGLTATVVDLPGSARIGREIVARGGNVRARAPRRGGHVRDRPRRSPRRGARVQHHPPPLPRAGPRAVRAGGGGGASRAHPCACWTCTTGPPAEPPTAAATWGCSSTSPPAPTPTPPSRSREWLRESGFDQVKVRRLPQLPGLALVRSVRRG